MQLLPSLLIPPLAQLLIANLIAGIPASAAPPKKMTIPQVQETSLRARAGEELLPKEQANKHATPSVMVPLKDSFVPRRSRSWDWSLETKISTHPIFGGKPTFGYGIANLQSLGPLSFFGVSAGFEKPVWQSFLGVNVIAEVTNRKSDFKTPTGLILPVQIQYFSYGLEPRWSYIFNSWLGATASIMVQSVIISHASLDSSMATWTVEYIERAPRLSADFYLSQAESSRQRVSLSWANHISTFGQYQSWSLAYGAAW